MHSITHANNISPPNHHYQSRDCNNNSHRAIAMLLTIPFLLFWPLNPPTTTLRELSSPAGLPVLCFSYLFICLFVCLSVVLCCVVLPSLALVEAQKWGVFAGLTETYKGNLLIFAINNCLCVQQTM